MVLVRRINLMPVLHLRSGILLEGAMIVCVLTGSNPAITKRASRMPDASMICLRYAGEVHAGCNDITYGAIKL